MSSPTTPASIGPGEFFPVVGVGPHEKPWPEGDQYDPELLLNGDRRNVLDHYRYWTVEAIVALALRWCLCHEGIVPTAGVNSGEGAPQLSQHTLPPVMFQPLMPDQGHVFVTT